LTGWLAYDEEDWGLLICHAAARLEIVLALEVRLGR
jgi:hypothetical protein